MIYKIHDWHRKGEQESPTCSSRETKRYQMKLEGSKQQKEVFPSPSQKPWLTRGTALCRLL